MTEQIIGEVAGEVWRYLDRNGGRAERMRARFEQRAACDRPAETFEQPFFAGLDEYDARRQKQNGRLQQYEPSRRIDEEQG